MPSPLGRPHTAHEAIKYETALKADKFVLMVHGSAEEQAKARTVLASSKAWQTV
ncbi:MAG: hypothetical protein P4L96_19205 [Rhodoferax sp.]|nr:hypothetical protein [Rhodoferax sp.]